jgi:histidinol dehydrogenase
VRSGTFRFTGPLDGLSSDQRHALLLRARPHDDTVHRRTAELLACVRTEGDAALRAMARDLDGVELDSLEVSRPKWLAALDALEPELLRALERAARNIATAHRAQLPRPLEVETELGVLVGRRADPLARVGVYAPGGRAAYPSSVLMGAVPARVAGVGEIILCSPPGPEGLPAPVLLAAAALAGVDRVFAIGGAGAIGALAYGTATVPRVNRIVGPGNAYVAEAKLQVSGVVAIDSPAGPSELLVITDGSARAATVAREVVAQAEHDPEAAVIVLAVGPARHALAGAVDEAVVELLPSQPRRTIVAASLAMRGGLLLARSLDEALDFANQYAPEHLLLAVSDPEAALAKVRDAGTVFLGESSSVTFGDYLTGANHVLPTGGLARSYAGLSTLDFVRWTSYQRITPQAAAHLAPDVARTAEAEGLPAHAAAARAWENGRVTGAMPTPTASAVARPGYRSISRYAPDTTPCAIDLSDNINLWGLPPAADSALRAAASDAISRYPSVYAEPLKEALAAYLGVEAGQVVTGCGSDDVLDSAIRAFGEPGDRIAYPDPTFSMIPVFARLNGLEPIPVPFTEDLDADADALLATGARVIYLCSPNNPTGTAISRKAVETIVQRAPGLVIMDEAYAEFAGASIVDLLKSSPRLLLTRTMSKAFGMAGLRVGYGAGAPALVEEVEKSRGPYKVSALAERAALAALGEGLPWVRAHAAEAVTLRERLTSRLQDLGLRPLPSAANFVLVPVTDAVATAVRMRKAGVAVRPLPGLPRFGDALRIGVGPWPMMEACLDALRRALS